MNNPPNLFDPEGENPAGALVLCNPPVAVLLVGAIVLVGGLLIIIWYAFPKPSEIDWSKGKPKGKAWKKDGQVWVNPRTNERVYPDLDSSHGRHVDYEDGKGGKYRVYPDGRIEPKK